MILSDYGNDGSSLLVKVINRNRFEIVTGSGNKQVGHFLRHRMNELSRKMSVQPVSRRFTSSFFSVILNSLLDQTGKLSTHTNVSLRQDVKYFVRCLVIKLTNTRTKKFPLYCQTRHQKHL